MNLRHYLVQFLTQSDTDAVTQRIEKYASRINFRMTPSILIDMAAPRDLYTKSTRRTSVGQVRSGQSV